MKVREYITSIAKHGKVFIGWSYLHQLVLIPQKTWNKAKSFGAKFSK